MRKLVLATRNEGKLTEVQALLGGLDLEIVTLADYPEMPEIPEDGATFTANAKAKALAVAQYAKEWSLADDSGLEVEVLHGAPGVHSARYSGAHGDDEANYRKLLTELRDIPSDRRGARFVCVLALASPEGKMLTAEGDCPGLIGYGPKGANGFGYDPVFFLPEFRRMMAELTTQEKNKISHRAKALKKMRPLIEAEMERTRESTTT